MSAIGHRLSVQQICNPNSNASLNEGKTVDTEVEGHVTHRLAGHQDQITEVNVRFRFLPLGV